MGEVGKILVVGGGIAGMSCALSLRRAGISVDLVEIDPAWNTYRSGLTLTGPALRALRQMGVLGELQHLGVSWDRARIFAQSGEFLEEVGFSSIAPELPPVLGILRPQLHRALSSRTLASGAHVRLGTTLETLTQVPGGVEVKLTNGHRERYALVVGADGIYSKLRERLFPHAARPRFTGQVIYRLLAERPRGLDCPHVYVTQDARLELAPVSRSHLYLSLLLKSPARPWVPLEDQARRLCELLSAWGGFAAEVRRTVPDGGLGSVNYRPLETVLLPDPWYRNRVLLVGDAAHTMTPQLASAVGMAAEDGVVLAEEVARDGDIDAALPRFMARRFERGRFVVENCLRLGELEMSRGSEREHSRVFQAAAAALAQPA